MNYIPPDAKWYLAELIEEIRIDGEAENIVHTNLILVRADSPEQAFERAVKMGEEANINYSNPDGKDVTVTFRGLRDLNVIHGELEHGTELIYEKRLGMTEPEIRKMVSTKEDLGVFKEER